MLRPHLVQCLSPTPMVSLLLALAFAGLTERKEAAYEPFMTMESVKRYSFIMKCPEYVSGATFVHLFLW